jgi:FMN reductase
MTDPFSIVFIVGSPSARSRTAALAQLVSERLSREAFRVHTIQVRDLPADALVRADLTAPAIQEAAGLVERADAVVIASPVYKAAYTGLLKTFLDLLPQRGLAGKVVLPLLTGGTLAHVLALDYGLRPVLNSLEPHHIVSGLFLLDQWITITETGSADINADISPRLELVTQQFIRSVRSAAEHR